MNAHAFDDFAPGLTDTYRVIGITRRGHGASSWPDSGYSVARRVEDVRIVLDSLGVDRAVLAGHSLAAGEITRLASVYPEEVLALIYIDAAHDPTLIDKLRIFEVCPTGPAILDAIERRFENAEAFRRTQMRAGPDGTLIPSIADAAMAELTTSFVSPDYSGVQAPALAIYHTPARIEDVLGGEAAASDECVSALQRYIYEGIAGFTSGIERGRVVGIDDTQHNIHLVSPDVLENIIRRWLNSLQELE